MNELNSLSLNDFVKLATVIWMKGFESIDQAARRSGLFREVPIGQNEGDIREFSEIDLEEYAGKKNQGDQAPRAKVQQGYSKFLKLYRVAKDIGITYEMRTRNKAPEVVQRLTNLGRLAPNRMDLDLTHRFTFGTATAYTDQDGESVDITTGDGFQLFYTAHTIKGSSTTYRNRLANNPQVSKGAIEGMEKLIVENTFNQFGQKIAMPFDVLWSTDDPNTCNVIREYLQSTASLESGQNAGVVNVYKGKYRHIILPRLATDANGLPDSTKAKYWGLASTLMTTAILGVHEEPHLKTPTPGSNGEDFATDDWTFGTRAGYGIATVSASWVKMSSGDGTA